MDRDLLKAYTLVFLYTFMMGAALPLVPQFLKEEFAATTLFIGVAAAVYGLLQVVLRLPMGNLTDVHGRKATLLVSFVASLLAGLFFVFAPDRWWILPGQVLFGLSSGIFWVSANSYVADVAPPHKLQTAWSHYTVAMGIGFLVAPPLSGYLADAFGFRVGLSVFIVASLASLAVLATMRETRKGAKRLTMGEAFRRGAALLAHADLAISAMGTFFFALILGVSSTFFPVYVRGIGFTAFAVGILLATREVSSIGSRLALPPVMRRVGARRILYAGVVLAALGVAAIPFLDSAWELGLLMVVGGIGTGIMIPANLTLITEASRPEERGLAMGIYGTALGLGSAASAFGFGYLGDALGLRFAFWASSALTVIGVAAVAYLARRRKAPGPA